MTLNIHSQSLFYRWQGKVQNLCTMSSDISLQATAVRNNENVKENIKQSQNKMLEKSRPALKPLNQNIGRIQPFRAAKQVRKLIVKIVVITSSFIFINS